MMPQSAVSPEFIPGTIHLVDLDGTIHSPHAKGSNHDIILVPAPSKSPDDPLNWSPSRKLLSLGCLGAYVHEIEAMWGLTTNRFFQS